MKIGGPKRGPKNGSKIGHFGHFLDPFFGPISGVYNSDFGQKKRV